MRFYLLSLGCPKNDVDSERIVGCLLEVGHKEVTSPSRADLLIVNTCAFIDAAKEESLDALLRLASRKRPGQRLLACGCLSQRYGEELRREIPLLDEVLGVEAWKEITRLVEGPRAFYSGQRPWRAGRTSAYLKIADGCSASCAFCVIPQIKGHYRSRPKDEILEEAEALVQQGAKELVLIAQDTTAYGYDLGLRDALPPLMEAILERTPQLAWLRVMYAHPQHISEGLIELLAGHPRVCHYLDLPLQHAHPRVLRAMRRPADVAAVRQLIARLRKAVPDIALRTSFILGYPGEDEERFLALLDFLEEMAFERVGFFAYSQEEGTPAAALPGQLSQAVKRQRLRQAMALQQRISLELNRKQVGRRLTVLLEGKDRDEKFLVGRCYRDAPEVDGLVLCRGEAQVGKMVTVRVIGALEYDLVGEL